jgi:serine/threonine protein phosphatase PrpC
LGRIFERDDLVVIALADGGGGMRSGEAASRHLIAAVASAVNDREFLLEKAQPWVDLFHVADRALASNGPSETTGVVVVLGSGGLIGVSAGESEAWVVTPTSTDDLTVGQQRTARLGSNRAIVATFERPALNGVLLVASDGLFKHAASSVIARVVQTNAIDVAAELLVELVRLQSGKMADDVSVILVRRNHAGVCPS